MAGELDETDLFLLTALQRDATTSNVELARQVGLSPAATLQRVRRMRRVGLIQGTYVRVDGALLGLPIRAHVLVRLPKHEATIDNRFQAAIGSLDVVVAGDWVTGEWDAALTVVAADLQDLHATIVKIGKAGATRTLTHIAVRELKAESPLPIGEGPPTSR
jgi:Lrp/AsnC family leucine-responsive transcriptional regulator